MLFHVDDLMLFGPKLAVENLFERMQQKMKLREVGRLEHSGDHCTFLNKQVRRTETGFTIMGNPKIAQALVERAGVANTKFMGTPAVRYTATQVETSAQLPAGEVTPYRSTVGGLMHIAQDRPDIQFATKEAARCRCPSPE